MAAFGKTMENVRKHRDSKPKYGEKVKLSYIDTGSFIVYVKKKKQDIYKDSAEDVKTRFDTSNVEIDRPVPMRKDEK